MTIEQLKSLNKEYNKNYKIKEGIIKILISTFLIGIAIAYFTGLTDGTIIETIINFVKSQFIASKLSSLFFIGLLGGLFFLSVPIEALFIGALIKLPYNGFLMASILLLGLFFGYSIDYFMGKYMSSFATKLVSPKKFYKVKIQLNKYGKGLVFMFNVLPLPSQILTFIAGVFKYNKARYFLIWISAWTIKLIVILLFRTQIINLIGFIKNIFI